MEDSEPLARMADALSKEDEAERVAAVVEVLKKAERAQWRDSWKWERDRAFVRGDQEGVMVPATTTSPSRWDVRTRERAAGMRWFKAINHIGKISAQILALNTQERPTFDAMAGTSEGEDRDTARTTKSLLGWIQRRHSFETLYGSCTQGAFDVGTRILFPRWDRRRGGLTKKTVVDREVEAVFETVKHPVTSEPMEMMVEPPRLESHEEEEPTGDIAFSLLEPEQIIVPAYATWRSSPDWIAVKEYLSVQDIEDLYGEDVAEEAETGTSSDTLESWGRNLRAPPGAGRNAIEEESASELVCHYTLFLRRSSKYPRGLKLLIAGGVLAEQESDNDVYPREGEPSNWFPNYDFPLFAFRWRKDESSWFGLSGVEPLIPLQQDINGYKTKARMIAAKHSGSRRKVPKGVTLPSDDDVTAVIEYSALRGGPDQIQWENPPQFPSELFLLGKDAREELEDISGINASIQGRAGSEDSGVKVREQKDRATGRIAPIKAEHDRVAANALLHAVTLMRRNAPDELVILAVGENDRTSVEVFRELSDISSMVDVYPVNNPLSSDPTQKMLQMGQIVQMIGQVQDPVTRSRVVAALGLEDVMQLTHFLDVHRTRALRENTNIARGRPPTISQFDEDQTHLSIHTADLLSESGESRGPEYKAAMEQHITEHMNQLAVKMQAQAPPPPAPGGAPGGPPQPSEEPMKRESAAAPRPAIA